MKYFYYKGNFYIQGVHHKIPAASVEITAEQYQQHRNNISNGHTFTHDDENNQPIYIAPVSRQIDHAIVAKQLLTTTHHFEMPTCRRYFEDDKQYQEFEEWRYKLHDVIQHSQELPETPEFIQKILT